MEPAPTPSDEELMTALGRGQDDALDALMTRWQIPLRAFLHRRLQNEADALDLAQETFVRIYRHRERFRTGARFSTWMFQIALNLIRDLARRRSRRPTRSLEVSDELTVDDTSRQPIEDAEAAAAVRAAIAELPDALRESLLLSTYQELSHAEIAEITGGSAKAVESRLYRARELLRHKLKSWLTD